MAALHFVLGAHLFSYELRASDLQCALPSTQNTQFRKKSIFITRKLIAIQEEQVR